jgi:hypothetical protein
MEGVIVFGLVILSVVSYFVGAVTFAVVYKYELGKFEKKEAEFKKIHQEVCSKYSKLKYEVNEVKEILKKLNDGLK